MTHFVIADEDAVAAELELRERERGPKRETALVQYQRDPLGFCVDVLGIPAHTLDWSLNPGYEHHVWDGTADPFMKVWASLVAERNVGVESATTTGKTFSGGATCLWFAACFENARVITVAPKKEQLQLHIWMEIDKLWPAFSARFPHATKDALRIRMTPKSDAWAIQGFVAGTKAEETKTSATKAQGFHAEHMLIVFEETPGIAPSILTAFKNTCRAPHNLRLAYGNPDHQLDPLHLFCEGPRTDHVIISAYDHPNIVTKNPGLIPGAVSQQGIDDALEDARNDGGEENRMFKSRVRGISPSEAKDSLIKLEWIRRANARWEDKESRAILLKVGKGKRALGCDVANSDSGDESAIARGIGAVLLEVDEQPCPNSNRFGNEIHLEMQRDGILPEHVGIDGVGVGAGAVNELYRFGRYIRKLNGGDGAEMGVGIVEEFPDLRSQMYWAMREALRLDEVALPPDPQLTIELITPKFEQRGNDVTVESKKDLKKRLPGGKSPNRSDAVVYWNWVRPKDPVVSERPKLGQTLEERVHLQIQAMDNGPRKKAAKRYYGTLRQ